MHFNKVIHYLLIYECYIFQLANMIWELSCSFA